MNWTTEHRVGTVVLHGTDDKGVELARLHARPKLDRTGWTIHRLWIAEEHRGDPAFREGVVLELVDQAKVNGWVTDDEIGAYTPVHDDTGKIVRAEAGTLTILYPDDPTDIVGVRSVLREKAEAIAAEKDIDIVPIEADTAVALGRDGGVKPVDEKPVDVIEGVADVPR